MHALSFQFWLMDLQAATKVSQRDDLGGPDFNLLRALDMQSRIFQMQDLQLRLNNTAHDKEVGGSFGSPLRSHIRSASPNHCRNSSGVQHGLIAPSHGSNVPSQSYAGRGRGRRVAHIIATKSPSTTLHGTLPSESSSAAPPLDGLGLDWSVCKYSLHQTQALLGKALRAHAPNAPKSSSAHERPHLSAAV
jgi:hypothetical protein